MFIHFFKYKLPAQFLGMKWMAFISFLLLTLTSASQVVSGIYQGQLVNDSTKRVQQYELALSEYKGKITGYAYTTFVVNDTFYYSIKRVTAQKRDSQLVVEDVKMLANNFPEAAAKNVRQITTIPLPATDTLITVNGTWATTRTKTYYALAGAVAMQKNNDSSRSALVTHLSELKVIAPPRNTTTTATKTTNTKKEGAIQVPFNQRKTNLIQTIEVNTDSLQLSFYDNGVVDGDSISVQLNNTIVLSKHLLTANAVKQTVYINSTTAGSFTLLLIAESLGTIPPNTGLLIVQDGTQKHHVNFSADMQTNATIVFKKRGTL